MIRITSLLVGLSLVLAPAVAAAQDSPVHINIGGGPTFTTGETGERFETGWGPAIGVTFDVGPKIGLQVEYAYRYFNVKDDVIGSIVPGASMFDANQQTHQIAFSVVANLTPEDSPIRVYVIGGPGAYHRKVEITQYVGSGVICDPWWWVCGVYPVSDIIGSRSTWDFGFNVGGGIGFALGDSGTEFFIESRYHKIYGGEVEVQSGFSTPDRVKIDGQFIPLTFGFRF